MHRPLRVLGALVAFALAALLLAAPAAAWRVHDVAHLGAEVAADEHHHHEGNEVVSDDAADGSHHENHDDDDDRDGGHDHMPSLAAGLSVLPVDTLLMARPEPSDTPMVEAPRKTPPDRTSPPQIRPPRLG